MAKLTVLKNYRIGAAVYIKDDVIEVLPDEAVVLLHNHKGVFAPKDFDPDKPGDEVGVRYQLFITRKLKIDGKLKTDLE